MPPRLARKSVSLPTSRTSNKKIRKRQLDAFAIAGKVAPEKSKIKSHRYGEVEDDAPRSKRRRTDDEDEEDSDIEEGGSRLPKRQRNQDEDIEYGSDSEGNEWVVGGLADDNDDESIDSDEAFGESDEERFEGFTFRGSSNTKGQRQKRHPKVVSRDDEIDLDEQEEQDSDEEEDDFGDEGVDLATMLDDDVSVDGEEPESESESGQSQSDEEEDDQAENEERHARLQDMVEALDKAKKPAQRSTANVEDALTLEDLLDDADLDQKTLATLKPRKKSQAAEVVKAALPKRQQDAIDRQIANKKAKEQLDRWRATVIQNRRADFLSFPLRNPDQAGPQSKDTFTPAQQNDPTTELEANIRQIMEESGLVTQSGQEGGSDAELDILKAEELATNKLPVEEALARRAELRRTRELLFREEIKAKRIAKIKSKAYRRVHRKERERLADKERMLLDPEGFANGELNEDEQEVADRRRAEARMSAKHKDSKWARSLRATDRTIWDDDARAGVIEAAKRQEELKRRIAGRDIDADDNDDDDDFDDEDNFGTAEQQLQALSNGGDNNEKKEKGLAALKFMQTAERRRKARNDATIAEIQRDLRPAAAEEDSGIEDNGLGRAVFGPKPSAAKTTKSAAKRPELEEGSASEDDDRTQDEPKVSNTKSEPRSRQRKTGSGPLAQLSASEPTAALPDQNRTIGTSAWLLAPKEKKSKLDQKLARSNEEAIISTRIDAQEVKEMPRASSQHDNTIGNTDGWTTVTYDDDDDDDNNNNNLDTEEQNEAPMLTKAERNAAFHARAFAGDDVALQFTAEKDALVASEDEKESSNQMPGWGSWTGVGLSKSARKAADRARHNPLYKTKTAGVKPQDRKDAKLQNVIISEKHDRKGKKYLAPILPHQYERKEEYERSLRMPLGPEWTTKETFQKNTRPRVVVKPGTIIEPMSRPLV